MSTELTTRASLPADFAGALPPVRGANGFKNGQVATVRYDEVSFGDMLEAINPLRHLPIVSNLYASETANPVMPAAKLIGGGLLGGVFGFALAAVNLVFEQATGKGVLGSVASAVSGESETANAPKTAALRSYAMAHYKGPPFPAGQILDLDG